MILFVIKKRNKLYPKKCRGGGYKYAHPLAFWENQMKTAAKLLQTRQFIQLTRIKSWDNIEKIGIIPTD